MADAISYQGLPISKGGSHHFRTKSAKQALTQISDFLENCTVPLEPYALRCDFKEGLVHGDTKHLVHLSNLLGTPVSGGVGVSTLHNWFLSRDQAFEVASYIDDIGQVPQDSNGSSLLYITYAGCFAIRSHVDNRPFPGFSTRRFNNFESQFGAKLGESSFSCTIERKSSIYLFLCLPGELSENDLQSQTAWLQAQLPFRFSRTTWLEWNKTKTGNGFIGRKLKTSVVKNMLDSQE